MKFPRFDMERMQSVWEHKVKYDLSESGVEALTLAEITRDPRELMKTRLGYAEGVGREATRTLIAAIHPGHDADGIEHGEIPGPERVGELTASPDAAIRSSLEVLRACDDDVHAIE